MEEFNIENVAADRFNNDDDEIGSNVISVELAEEQLTFPMPVPHQSELKKANDAKIKLKSSMLQFIHRVETDERINTKATKDKIIEKIKIILEDNPDLTVDVFFQFWKDIAPTETERKNILEIQFEAGLLMIADYESNPNQSIEKFEKQLKEVLKKYPKNIICPTLDMGMKPVELFEEKIQILPDHGIKKFNVIYRHIINEQDNWIALSKKIYGKDIWCNVVGIPQQYFTNSDKFVCINLHAQINIITQKDLRSTKSSYKTCQVVVMRKSSYSYKQR